MVCRTVQIIHKQTIKMRRINYYSPEGLSVTCADSHTYYLLTCNKQLTMKLTYFK